MVQDSKPLKEELFLELEKLPAIDGKAITAFDKKQKKIEKVYNKVHPQEVYSLDISLIKWLKPRLILLTKSFEKIVDLEEESQKILYDEVKEMISLSDFIIETKWFDAFEDEDKSDPDIDELFIREGDHYIMTESSPERKEYFKKVNKCESDSKDRYVELLSKNFWRLWI